MPKIYINKNVYDATQERIEYIFKEFDNVLVAFSGGKDSGILINLCYKYAEENNLLSKLAMYYEDYEAGYQLTTEYVERTFKDLEGIKKYWLCLPISAACSVSMYQTSWIPWDRDQKDIWVRDYPKSEYLITEDNVPFNFKKGTTGFDTRIDFSKWFSSEYGNTAVLVGLRCDESLQRLSIVTSSQRKFMYKDTRYSKIVNENTINFYPIYDWRVEDVWTANYKFAFDYNKLYDLFYQAGLNIAQMRTASPFHQCGQDNLKLYKVIDPKMWGKMLGRVNGVNFTGIYGGTTAMGWKSVQLPKGHTWKSYMEFLLSTLPEEIRNKYLEKIEKSKWHWRVQGGARSEQFIKELESEGVNVRRSGTTSKSCKVNVDKELIYIDDMMDDTNCSEFRKAPSYKRVCITIMKNDIQCQYMGFSRTKQDMDRRKKTMDKYKNIIRGRDEDV